eukprot:TRINITY_DN41279_c0_g1_i1.p1 TRINITY_DN41279_c0_g1~~TRINITY_DN41279_c0_g1_i1.p1  ORF type:complete len:287 (-),score=46.38 TRINITY_DN41279_c0_g1_i1:63-923(-)
MAGVIHVALVLGFITSSAVAERPAQSQDQLDLAQAEHPLPDDHSEVVGPKGIQAIEVPSGSDNSKSAAVKENDPATVPSSLLNLNSTHGERVESVESTWSHLDESSSHTSVTCGLDAKAKDHDTLGTCTNGLLKCGASGFGIGVSSGSHQRGDGCLCDPEKKGGACVCAPGFCAVGEDDGPIPDGDTTSGRCKRCDDNAEVDEEDILAHGATKKDRDQAKEHGWTKKVGTCKFAKCSEHRVPHGGGVGCNRKDDVCYCLHKDFYASKPGTLTGSSSDGNRCVNKRK